ncbi:hypothetical protein ANCCEY_03045 [Ancylostoma ceylanicum]|uniref:Uncharacterized protein n=1 Tax=Ancylostoma ceylanicum TaxID=53326 RepID=A0A0D6M1D4_9BILA|nr:hypothetical protein ANCCEY_03045 [Ancylostoma ceylanicum]
MVSKTSRASGGTVACQDGQSVRSMGIFATVYIFDTDVSKQMQTQARIESVYRKTKKSFFKVGIPPQSII